MLSLIGLLTMIFVMLLLLSGHVIPLVALTLVPIIGVGLAGFHAAEISVFFRAGLAQVTSTAVMFVFAILYFGIMQDVGLFTPLIQRVIKFSKSNLIAICVGTVIVGAIANHIVAILPNTMIPHLHLIIGYFGVPFELLLSTDAYYFALLPVVEAGIGISGH